MNENSYQILEIIPRPEKRQPIRERLLQFILLVLHVFFPSTPMLYLTGCEVRKLTKESKQLTDRLMFLELPCATSRFVIADNVLIQKKEEV